MKKKIMSLFLLPLLFIGINTVKADTVTYDYGIYYLSDSELSSYIDLKSEELISYWEDNFSSEYPYYYIGLSSQAYNPSLTLNGSYSRVDVYLHYSKNFNGTTRYYGNQNVNVNVNNDATHEEHALIITAWASSPSNVVYSTITPISSSANFYYYPTFNYQQTGQAIDSRTYQPLTYYDSNFSWVYTLTDSATVVKDNDTILSISNGDIIPTYKQLNGILPSNYVEYNLNNYDYITLTLKDYNLRNNNNTQFSTTIYTLGSLCLTPVYNYGMNQKNEYYSGYKVQGCSENYTSYTGVDVSILKSDLQNNVVYYIKSPNYTTDNKVKIDTSIFNVDTFSANDTNPTVDIGGRTYPIIPYNNLTDTAIISTNEGYVSGVTCAIGDLNCFQQYNDFSFSDIFTHPLEILQSFWGSITSIFSVITAFITLLPTPLQTFMFTAFMFAVVLGIIKMILG